MNIDDPKLTAYALDELDTAERAEIEVLLKEEPAFATEIDATRTIATQLRNELNAEEGAPLSPPQRAEIFAATRVVSIPRARRPWLALAAGIAIIAALTALIAGRFIQKNFHRRTELAMNSVQQRPVILKEMRADATTAVNFPGQVTAGDAEKNKVASSTTMPPPLPALELASPEGSIVVGSGASNTVSISPAAPGDAPASFGIAAPMQSRGSASKTLILSGANSAGLAKAEGDTWVVSDSGNVRSFSGALVPNESNAGDGGAPAPQRLAGNSGVVIRSGGDVPAKQVRLETFTKPGAAAPNTMQGPMGGGALALAAKDGRRKEKFEDQLVTLYYEQSRPGLEPSAERNGNTASYDAIADNAFLTVKDNPLSTFSIDVDTASYANVRRFLNNGQLPPKGAVRIEEMLNYFSYDYPQPAGDAPFSATMEVAACPWAPEHRLVRIGLRGRDLARSERPAVNLVFLIDVSGSMSAPNRLPLVKQSLRLLVDQLRDEDRVAIAVYAGASGTVLEPTRDKQRMRHALDRLQAGGSTNGAAGIQLAYQLAEKSFIKSGTNRVILATDGDFNVGVTNQSELIDLIEKKAKSGVFLTVLGFGMDNLKDSTLEKLADKGNGNYGYIDTLLEAKKMLVEQMNGTLFTIAKDVKIQVEFNPAQAAAYRLIGYENRVMAKEDFNDDKKDAGEIGAGHTVTALYEIVPAGAFAPGVTQPVDELKYSAEKSEIRNQKSEMSPELLTLKLRYKQPDGDVSAKLEFPLTDRGETWEKSSRDFRWAAAVASFGMLLRDSPHKGRTTWDSALELAHEGKAEDGTGYRAECIALLEKARAVK